MRFVRFVRYLSLLRWVALPVVAGSCVSSLRGQPAVVPAFDTLVYMDDETVSVPLLRLNGVGGNFSAAEIPYLSYLKAMPDGQHGVRLQWTKTDERRAAYYAIERSPDGRVFHTIGRMKARGDDGAQLNYLFRDRRLLRHKALYRLRQVNLDGSESFSHEVIYERPQRAPKIALEPLPDSERTYLVKLDRLDRGERLRMELLCPRGKRLRKRTIRRKEFKLPTKGLHAGVYTLRIMDDDQWHNRRLVLY